LVYSGGAIGYCITRKLNLAVLKAPNSRFNTSFVGAGNIRQNGDPNTTESFTQAIAEQTMTILA